MRRIPPEWHAMQAVALVIDRHSSKDCRAGITTMGGGWLVGLDLFDSHPDQFAFLFLVAPTKKRIRRAAPLVMMAANIDAFRECVRASVSMMDDVKCLWVRAVEGEPLEILNNAILHDSVPGGSA